MGRKFGNFVNFENLAILEIKNGHFGVMAKNIGKLWWVPIYASFFFKFQQRTWKLKIKIIVKIILFTDNFKWKILTQVFLLKWARNFGILSLDVLRLKKYSQFRRRLTGKHIFWNLGHFLSLSFFILYWINYNFFLIFNCQVLRWNL